jgi:prevent-host-death family protein
LTKSRTKSIFEVEGEMRSINIHEAKTNFSRLLERVATGEEVIIAKAGKPVARLVPYAKQPSRRVAGGDVGSVTIAEDFDAPLPDDLLAEFES